MGFLTSSTNIAYRPALDSFRMSGPPSSLTSDAFGGVLIPHFQYSIWKSHAVTESAQAGGTTCFFPGLNSGGRAFEANEYGWVQPVGCAPYAFFAEDTCGVCGDGKCAGSETTVTCPDDCVEERADVAVAPDGGDGDGGDGGGIDDACGDNMCGDGEDCALCPVDCGPCVFSGPYTVCLNAELEGPALALTFDDGPTNTTEAVLDLLKK